MAFHAIPPVLDVALESLRNMEAVTLRAKEPLADHVSMGVGGPARWLLTVEKPEALQPALAAVRASGLRWMMLGGGSNTFFTDAGFDGFVVMLGRGFRELQTGPQAQQVTAGAAAPLSAVMNFARRNGLAGLEFCAGIPGTLGGALAGNAGTVAGDVCSLAEAVTVIDAAGREMTRRCGEFCFSYRWSQLREDVIVRATLALCADQPEAIKARIDAALAKRGEQPLGVRCSGCMFKNPPGDFAGRLIDRAGLKGLRVGGAYVAEEHANFVINDGTATAADIQALVEEIRRRVREKWGVELELEIRLVGEDGT